LIPILNYLYQRRLFHAEETALKNYVDARTSEIQAQIMKEVKSLFEAEVQKITGKIKEDFEKHKTNIEKAGAGYAANLQRQLHQIHAGPFHVQMNLGIKNQDYISAMQSGLDAIDHEVQARDEPNLRRTLTVLTEQCLPKMNKVNLTQALQLERQIIVALERVEKEWGQNQFYDAVVLFKLKLNEAMSR
jgi:hypothetical protein